METVNESKEQVEPQLPTELTTEGIKVIDVPAPTFGTRKVFVNLKPEHIAFKQGQRVLPADFVGAPDQGPVYYDKTYPIGTKFYKDGGHKCITQYGGYRTFYLDALMIHPTEMKLSQRVEVDGSIKRGRKSNPNKPKKDPDAPKGKRGRKPLDPTLKAAKEAEKEAKLITNPDRKRGRKPLSEEEKAKRAAIPVEIKVTTGKRGRPSIDPSLRKSKPYVPNGGKRGRPKKS